MKIYNGIDICVIDRVAATHKKFGDKFLNRVFSSEELLEAGNIPNVNYLAKRFAAKEAFSKAIGEGIGNIAFKDISIVKNQHGAPILNLSETAQEYLLKSKNWLEYDIAVSLSDDGGMAIASVVILVKF
ncbi:MAG: holo-ACP synthase [Alphaproteobacteria bacterium]|jgi:holo-[acyl-carrier protein] synthase|nr:holo-ACP synthase [Alphaproteobacteria bacterium]